MQQTDNHLTFTLDGSAQTSLNRENQNLVDLKFANYPSVRSYVSYSIQLIPQVCDTVQFEAEYTTINHFYSPSYQILNVFIDRPTNTNEALCGAFEYKIAQQNQYDSTTGDLEFTITEDSDTSILTISLNETALVNGIVTNDQQLTFFITYQGYQSSTKGMIDLVLTIKDDCPNVGFTGVFNIEEELIVAQEESVSITI